jgi:hypothetical protein
MAMSRFACFIVSLLKRLGWHRSHRRHFIVSIDAECDALQSTRARYSFYFDRPSICIGSVSAHTLPLLRANKLESGKPRRPQEF